MARLIMNGGKKLFGEIEITSAKNSFLTILAGCILSSGEVVLHKYPNYSDTISMCEILRHLGAKITHQEDAVIIDSSGLDSSDVPTELASLVRSSIFALGAIIGRFKKAKVAYPGGCEIGARPIDIHLYAPEVWCFFIEKRAVKGVFGGISGLKSGKSDNF